MQAIAATKEDTEKTLVQFWKHYIYNCIRNLVWAWGDVTKECLNGIGKKTLKKFIHDFKGLVNEEVAKINKAAVETVNIFNLGEDENDIEDLAEVFSEEVTKEELLEVEEESREKETTREEKEESQKKVTVSV